MRAAPRIYARCAPFAVESATLALESGVAGLLTDNVPAASALALCDARPDDAFPVIRLAAKADEQDAAARLAAGEDVVIARGWEVIPLENLLAHPDPRVAGRLAVEVATPEEARLALGILERGVPVLVVTAEGLPRIKDIMAAAREAEPPVELVAARVRDVRPVGMGHRVCVDTLSLLRRGQGMLTGNSSAFLFLVHAETEPNEYVAARPFRVNAGGVHAYALLPGDATRYLEEFRPGGEALIVGADGAASRAVVGRVKVEARPMLLIEAETADGRCGGVFVQNAETVRLVRPGGEPVSVVALRPGDEVLCRADQAGRHFGMRIQEDIRE